MRLKRKILMLILLVLTFSVALAGDVRPGLWHLSLSVSAVGADQRMGPFEKTQCFTEADARDPGKLFADMGGSCNYGDKNYQGNRFSFTIQCDGAFPMTGSGFVEYDAAVFQGELNLRANVPNAGEVQTRSQVTGKRIGDC